MRRSSRPKQRSSRRTPASSGSISSATAWGPSSCGARSRWLGRESSVASCCSRRQSRCPAGGLGAAALRPAPRRGEGAFLASRQLREPARASGGSRLRRHRGVVGPRRLARVNVPAGPARSLSPSQPSHAPAASAHAGASGALPARRSFPARDRLTRIRQLSLICTEAGNPAVRARLDREPHNSPANSPCGGICHDSAKAFRNIVQLGSGGLPAKTGAQVITARRFPAAVSASLLIAGAFSVFLFSAVDARAQGPRGTCEDAAELAVLPSPVAPWKGAPLRVIFAAEKPLEGELSLIAPNGSVAAKSRERLGGPPYFWFAEVAAPAAGKWQARLARERAPAECSTITREIAVLDREPPRPRSTRGQRLARAQCMESRDGKPVFRMDREALRRAARRGAVVEGAA